MKEYEEWFAKAEKDLKTAKYNLKGNELEAAAFFLQQSAEKALKALLIKKTKKLMKVHDLVILARKVDAPKEIIGYCQRLTIVYQQVRYPDISYKTNLEEEINELLIYAEEILKWTKNNL